MLRFKEELNTEMLAIPTGGQMDREIHAATP